MEDQPRYVTAAKTHSDTLRRTEEAIQRSVCVRARAYGLRVGAEVVGKEATKTTSKATDLLWAGLAKATTSTVS